MNQLSNRVRMIKMKTKKTEPIINPFTVTEDQQHPYVVQLKYAGPLFSNSHIKTTPYDYFAEKDFDPLLRDNCRTYAIIIRRHDFQYCLSLFAKLEHIFTAAYGCHRTLILKDVHINLEQKQLSAPDCIKNKNL